MKLTRKWILVATLLLSMAMVTTGTLAYLTDTDSRTNTFTMGKVDISIIEIAPDTKLTPGATANKDAEIKNDGDTDAYVWMTVVLDENLDKLVELAWNGYTPTTLTSEDPGYVAGKTTYLVKYSEVLAAGDSTDKILDAVTMKGNVDVQGDKLVLIENGQIVATYEGARDNLQVTVNAYAVQADGMNGVDDAYNKYYAQWDANGGGTSGEGGNLPTTEFGADEIADLPGYLDESGNLVVNDPDATLAVDDALEISAGVNVNLDLGGASVTAPYLQNNGTAVIENGTLEATATQGVAYGTRTAVGGVTTYNNFNMTTLGGGINVWGTVVFNSGSITTNSVSTNPRHMFYVAGDEGDGHLTINGGEFTLNPTNKTRKGSYLCAEGEDATIIVNGGIFHEPSTRTAPIQALSGGTVTIYGGKFAFDPSAYVAEGYQAVKGADGYWTVSAE